MKLTYRFRICLLIVGCIAFRPSYADFACAFDLRFGVVVGKNHIRVIDESRTLYQINQQKQTFAGGRLVSISKQQEPILKQYSESLEVIIPEITLLAKEGIGIVADNILRIYSGLVGENSSGMEELHASMNKAKKRVKERYGNNGSYFFIYPGKLENEDELSDELQQQIASGFSNISGILTAIGTLDISDEEEDTQDEYILRKRAKKACKKLAKLNRVEEELHAQIPELKKLDVIRYVKPD